MDDRSRGGRGFCCPGPVELVASHPEVAPELKAHRRAQAFIVRVMNHVTRTTRMAVVGGLMCRARESEDDGFRPPRDEPRVDLVPRHS